MSDESDRLRNAQIQQEIEAARMERFRNVKAALDNWFARFHSSTSSTSSTGYATFPPPQRPAADPALLKLLGLAASFTLEELKKAYRAKALLTHPDRGGSASEFNEVTTAYEKLVPYARSSPKS